MHKKIKAVFLVNAIVSVFLFSLSCVYSTSVFASSSAWNTPCGSGSFAGASYLSTPCGSSYNCCIPPVRTAVSNPEVQANKPAVPAVVAKTTKIVKKAGSNYNISANSNDIHFGFNASILTAADVAILRRDADYLKHNPDVVVQIQGNCDRRGSEEYNMALGWRRANTAKAYLEKLGISGNRLKTISFGKEKPICHAHANACYAINRRDHFVVVSK